MSAENITRDSHFIPDEIQADEVFIGLDLDRFLLSVDKTYGLLRKSIDDLYPEFVHQLDQAKSEVENDGGSFNPIELLDKTLGPDNTQKILDVYVFNALKNPEAYMEDGAWELLKVLEDKAASYGIITYTTDSRWSQAKLDGAALGDIDVYMTAEKDKRQLILSWLDRDRGVFNLPHELGDRAAKWVLFGDDKAKVVEDFRVDDQMGGWWYTKQSSEALLPSQRPSRPMPPGVIQVSSLYDVANDIAALYS